MRERSGTPIEATEVLCRNHSIGKRELMPSMAVRLSEVW